MPHLTRVTLPLFFAFVLGSVAIVVTGVTLLFGMDIVANFYTAVEPTSIGGFTEADLDASIGNAWNFAAAIPFLGLVASVLLAVLVGGGGGDSGRREPPRSGGPPF